MADLLNNLGSNGAVYLEMGEATRAHGNNYLQGDNNISVVVGYLDGQISQLHDAYATRSADVYKSLAIYVAIEGAVLSAPFSSAHQMNAGPTGCSYGWSTTPLILSAIASAAVIYTVLRKFVQQFHLLKRGRQLQEERRNFLVESFLHRRGITLTVINRFLIFNYNRGNFICPEAADHIISEKYHSCWAAQRAAYSGFLIAFSLCLLLLSCSCSRIL